MKLLYFFSTLSYNKTTNSFHNVTVKDISPFSLNQHMHSLSNNIFFSAYHCGECFAKSYTEVTMQNNKVYEVRYEHIVRTCIVRMLFRKKIWYVLKNLTLRPIAFGLVFRRLYCKFLDGDWSMQNVNKPLTRA